MNKIILCLSFLLVSSVAAQSAGSDLQRFGENFEPFNLGEALRKREERELIRQQRLLTEEYRRTIELENQRRERELARLQQLSQVPKGVQDALNESWQAMHAERVTYCMEERAISEMYCRSIASNELAIAFDGYIRAEPYRSRQTQYVEAKMAH